MAFLKLRKRLTAKNTLLLGCLASTMLTTGCQRKKAPKNTWEQKAPSEEIATEETATLSKSLGRDWRKVNAQFWYHAHPRIDHWRKHYNASKDPWILWKRAEIYMPTIRKIFSEYHLPNELTLLPMIESSFNPDARSQRAAGLWQFIAGTAKDMGLQVRPKLDERLDWEKSTVAAAKYLSFLANKFHGDWGLVLAAYNMGPGAIERAVVEQRARDFWQLEVREETTQYVPKFLAMIQLLRESYPDS